MTDSETGDEPDMGHVETKSSSPTEQDADRRFAADRTPAARPSDPLRADARWSIMPTTTGTAVLRCDWCRGEVDPDGAGRVIRCNCGQRVSVPSRVRVRCGRCGFCHWVRARELQAERLCAECGQPLIIQDIVLAPLRRHRPTRISGSNSGPRGNAVWTMLLLGMALLAAFVLFSKL